jgi:hypothetical protein
MLWAWKMARLAQDRVKAATMLYIEVGEIETRTRLLWDELAGLEKRFHNETAIITAHVARVRASCEAQINHMEERLRERLMELYFDPSTGLKRFEDGAGRMGTCAYCQKPMEVQKRHKEYCSSTCRVKAFQDREQRRGESSGNKFDKSK